MVLDGGAGKGQAVVGAEKPRGLGGFAGGVFDRLGFVENHVIEADVAPLDDVVAEGAVGGEDQVEILKMIGGLEAIGGGVIEDAKLGGEFRGLLVPVEDEGARDDDQGGAGWGLSVGEGRLRQKAALFEEGQDLDGFPEAHVIGEASVKAEHSQEIEPAEAVALIGAERSDESFGWIDGLNGFESAELVADFGESFIDALGRNSRPEARRVGRPGFW